MTTASPARLGASDWIAKEGDGFVALLLVCVVVFAGLPFARLLIAALAPGGHFDPAATFAAATSRIALIAAWNTIETGVLSSMGALVLGGAFAIALAVTDIRGKRVLAFLFVMSLLVAPQVAALAYKTLAGPASPILNAIGSRRRRERPIRCSDASASFSFSRFIMRRWPRSRLRPDCARFRPA